MQLITTIPPRRDGVVHATSPDGRKKFTFKPDEAGQYVCDVDDDATVALLLRSESFYPADEADFNAAMKLANPGGTGDGEDGGEGTGDGQGDGGAGDEDGDADEGSPDGSPVEAGTQPVIATPAAVRRARNRG